MQTDFVEPRWISYLNALSTVAVAFFALVALLREGRDRFQRSMVANARVSVLADALHRVLKDWRTSFPVGAMASAEREATESDRISILNWLDSLVADFSSVEGQALDLAREGSAGSRATMASAAAAATTVLHLMHIARRQQSIQGLSAQGARQVGLKVDAALRESEDLLELVAHRTRQRRLYNPKPFQREQS